MAALWEIEERRRREVAERAAARYRRICELNEMENGIAESNARAERLAQLRLRNEAAARRERLAAWEAKQAAEKAAAEAERKALADAVALVAKHAQPRTGAQARATDADCARWAEQGRAAGPQQNGTRRADTPKQMVKVERRAFNEAGELMSDWLEVVE